MVDSRAVGRAPGDSWGVYICAKKLGASPVIHFWLLFARAEREGGCCRRAQNRCFKRDGRGRREVIVGQWAARWQRGHLCRRNARGAESGSGARHSAEGSTSS